MGNRPKVIKHSLTMALMPHPTTTGVAEYLGISRRSVPRLKRRYKLDSVPLSEDNVPPSRQSAPFGPLPNDAKPLPMLNPPQGSESTRDLPHLTARDFNGCCFGDVSPQSYGADDYWARVYGKRNWGPRR